MQRFGMSVLNAEGNKHVCKGRVEDLLWGKEIPEKRRNWGKSPFQPCNSVP